MSTISTTTHRKANKSHFVSLTIALALILALLAVLSIFASNDTLVPGAGSQSSYVDYLRGEKVFFSNPIAAGNAFSQYRLGEKMIFAASVTWFSNNAMPAYRTGEKNAALGIEAVLQDYRRGEK